ncbi:MAG: RNA polymerase sigma-70 factor [Bacteroidales bacterium]|nr:RNA polymerase sigma-70 factor [Bacteroidales bacterium]
MSAINEKSLLERIKVGDKAAFSVVFVAYYSNLVMFAITFIREKQTSEEIVQDVFVKLWDNREILEIKSSLKSFLMKSVQNKCIDCIRHQKIRNRYSENILNNPKLFENETESYMLYSELERHIDIVLQRLPDKINQAYSLNRFDGMTYQEIADKLKVSVRTIEVRVSKALNFLRANLKDYMNP